MTSLTSVWSLILCLEDVFFVCVQSRDVVSAQAASLTYQNLCHILLCWIIHELVSMHFRLNWDGIMSSLHFFGKPCCVVVDELENPLLSQSMQDLSGTLCQRFLWCIWIKNVLMSCHWYTIHTMKQGQAMLDWYVLIFRRWDGSITFHRSLWLSW